MACSTFYNLLANASDESDARSCRAVRFSRTVIMPIYYRRLVITSKYLIYCIQLDNNPITDLRGLRWKIELTSGPWKDWIDIGYFTSTKISPLRVAPEIQSSNATWGTNRHGIGRTPTLILRPVSKNIPKEYPKIIEPTCPIHSGNWYKKNLLQPPNVRYGTCVLVEFT